MQHLSPTFSRLVLSVGLVGFHENRGDATADAHGSDRGTLTHLVVWFTKVTTGLNTYPWPT